MKTRIIIFLLAAFSLFLLCVMECNAQRHVPGQHVISADGFAWSQYGGSLSWGRCGYYGRTVFGATFLTGPGEAYTVPATNTEPETIYYGILSRDWYASGGYLFRVVSNRSRSVNLMLGGTVDLGARVHVVPDGSKGIPKAKFIYGLSPVVELEYFPDRSMALNIHVRPRFQLYGHKVFEKVFYPEIGVGCSFYIL